MRRFNRVVIFLLFAIAIAGLFRLKLDVEILNLLPKNNSVAEGLRLYQRYFLNSRELIVTVQSSDPAITETVTTNLAASLTAQSNLVAKVFSEPPWMSSPTAIADLISFLWLNAPPDRVAELNNNLSPQNVPGILQSNLTAIANSLSPQDMFLAPYDPFNLTKISSGSSSAQTPERFFVSSDRTFHMIYVQSGQPLDSYKQCENWLTQIRVISSNVLARTESSTRAQVHFTGRPVFVSEIASGMESDMSTTVTGTLGVIGLFFYLSHRRLRPLLILFATLLILLFLTASIGAFALGTLNVISVGFAAILLGLAEDYGIVLYQESLTHPEFNEVELRKAGGPGIFWSAVTSAAAFALLNLSSLPGLRQLGTLIAIGMLLAAWGMLYLFLPVLLKMSHRHPEKATKPKFRLFQSKRVYPIGVSRVVTILLLLASAALLVYRVPKLDRSPDALRPKQSEASRTLALVQKEIGSSTEPYWLVVQGKTVQEVKKKLLDLEPFLGAAMSNGVLSSFNLPTELWPDPEKQNANAPSLKGLAERAEFLRTAAKQAGFTDDALVLTSRIFSNWRTAPKDIVWPAGPIAEWLLPKFVARTDNGFLALGLIYPGATFSQEKFSGSLPANVLLSGWGLLGKNIFVQAMRELPLISGAIALVVIISLWFTFHTLWDVVLSICSLLFSGILLCACMSIFGWQWNLLNLISIPLLIGMGVDYSIHIQLALHRYEGDRLKVRQSIGSALLLAGSTTIAGFASLSFSSNYGMATLGAVCALGLTVALLSAVYLLPSWWREPRKN